MRIISRKRLLEFADQHADSRDALFAWHQIAKAAQWKSLAEVRQAYPNADAVGNKTVFNIKGNRYRLITAIHYNTGKVFIRAILTHAEYDRGDWRSQ